MRSMREKIAERLNAFPNEYAALRDNGIRYLDEQSVMLDDGTCMIGHRPSVAPEYYGMTLFPPAKEGWINNFKIKAIPKFYSDFLRVTNGLFAFDLSLYGLAPSMQEHPPLLDRSVLQCHDLTLANQSWIYDYDIDESLFHFGGRAYNYDENIGYFTDEEANIIAVRAEGEVVGSWRDFGQFLDSEITAAEKT